MVTPQENFGRWMDEHYLRFDEAGRPNPVCKRCGMVVHYVTKHAVKRHGDDIEVMPVARGKRKLARSY